MKIAVALSGGVDSACSALMLKMAGHEVIAKALRTKLNIMEIAQHHIVSATPLQFPKMIEIPGQIQTVIGETMTKKVIDIVVSHGIAAAGAYWVNQGLATHDDIAAVTGAVSTLAGIALAVYQRWLTHERAAKAEQKV